MSRDPENPFDIELHEVSCLDCAGTLAAHDATCPTLAGIRAAIADDRAWFSASPFRYQRPRPACFAERSYARAWEAEVIRRCGTELWLAKRLGVRWVDEVGLTALVRKVGDHATGGRLHFALSNGISYESRLRTPLPMVDPNAARSFGDST